MSRRTQGPPLLDEDSTERQRIVEASESFWGSCCSRTSSALRRGSAAEPAGDRTAEGGPSEPGPYGVGPGKCSTPRCAMGTRAAASGSTDTRHRWLWILIHRSRSSSDHGCGRRSPATLQITSARWSWWSAARRVRSRRLRRRLRLGDAAYGDGGTRQAFADAGRTLIAKLPRRPDSKRFPKEDFDIDLESGACTCPAGHTTSKL